MKSLTGWSRKSETNTENEKMTDTHTIEKMSKEELILKLDEWITETCENLDPTFSVAETDNRLVFTISEKTTFVIEPDVVEMPEGNPAVNDGLIDEE